MQQFLLINNDPPLQQEALKSASTISNLETPVRSHLSKPSYATLELSPSPSISKEILKTDHSDIVKELAMKKETTKAERTQESPAPSPGKRVFKRTLSPLKESSKERTHLRKTTSKVSTQATKKTSPVKYKVPRGISPMRYQQLLSMLDSIVTKEMKPRKLKEKVRRKSCTCFWCGGESKKEKKWCHVMLKVEEKKPEEQKVLQISLKKKKNNRKNTHISADSNNSIDLDAPQKHKTLQTLSVKEESPLEDAPTTPKIAVVGPSSDCIIQTQITEQQEQEQQVQPEQQPEQQLSPSPLLSTSPIMKIPKKHRKSAVSLEKPSKEEKNRVKMPPITPNQLKRSSSGNISDNSFLLYAGNKVLDLRYKPTNFTPVKLVSSEKKLETQASNTPSMFSTPFKHKEFINKSEYSRTPDISLAKIQEVQAPYIEYSKAIRNNKVMPKSLSLLKKLSEAQFPPSPSWSPSASFFQKPLRQLEIKRIGDISSVKSSFLMKEFKEREFSMDKIIPSGFSFVKNSESFHQSVLVPRVKERGEDTVDKLELTGDQESGAAGKSVWNSRTVLKSDEDKVEVKGNNKQNKVNEKVTYYDGYQLAKKVYALRKKAK